MSSILRKAAKYRRLTQSWVEGEAHLKDLYTPPPTIIQPPTARKELLPDDITNFPEQQMIPIPEFIPYPEGKYRPASIPYTAGYYPYNMYLQKGKIYQWCSCGISQNGPWCDSICNSTATRNRPIMFNVNDSGYYKMCNCKQSANAPFCNGTHRNVIRYYHKTHKGFIEIWGYITYMIGSFYVAWNFYS